jgi:hypothetical protein
MGKSAGMMLFGVNGKIWVEDKVLKWIMSF